jgi:hypothetical protein
VLSAFGAGAKCVWRRCGKRVDTCASGERMSPICGAGTQEKTTPAPAKANTCAKEWPHLRQRRQIPAPKNGHTCATESHKAQPAPKYSLTCAKDRVHLRQKSHLRQDRKGPAPCNDLPGGWEPDRSPGERPDGLPGRRVTTRQTRGYQTDALLDRPGSDQAGYQADALPPEKDASTRQTRYQTIVGGMSTREARWVARSPRRARRVDQ